MTMSPSSRIKNHLPHFWVILIWPTLSVSCFYSVTLLHDHNVASRKAFLNWWLVAVFFSFSRAVFDRNGQFKVVNMEYLPARQLIHSISYREGSLWRQDAFERSVPSPSSNANNSSKFVNNDYSKASSYVQAREYLMWTTLWTGLTTVKLLVTPAWLYMSTTMDKWCYLWLSADKGNGHRDNKVNSTKVNGSNGSRVNVLNGHGVLKDCIIDW